MLNKIILWEIIKKQIKTLSLLYFLKTGLLFELDGINLLLDSTAHTIKQLKNEYSLFTYNKVCCNVIKLVSYLIELLVKRKVNINYTNDNNINIQENLLKIDY